MLIGTIPPDLGNLTKLEFLWLNHNQLTGQVPTTLATLTHLDYLDLASQPALGRDPVHHSAAFRS